MGKIKRSEKDGSFILNLKFSKVQYCTLVNKIRLIILKTFAKI